MKHNRLTDLLQDIDDLIDGKCFAQCANYKNKVNFTTFQNYENPSARGHISIYSTLSHWSVELAQIRNFFHVNHSWKYYFCSPSQYSLQQKIILEKPMHTTYRTGHHKAAKNRQPTQTMIFLVANTYSFSDFIMWIIISRRREQLVKGTTSLLVYEWQHWL
jgi:hypothetical protein